MVTVLQGTAQAQYATLSFSHSTTSHPQVHFRTVMLVRLCTFLPTSLCTLNWLWLLIDNCRLDRFDGESGRRRRYSLDPSSEGLVVDSFKFYGSVEWVPLVNGIGCIRTAMEISMFRIFTGSKTLRLSSAKPTQCRLWSRFRTKYNLRYFGFGTRSESKGFKCLPKQVPVPQPVFLRKPEKGEEHNGEEWIDPLIISDEENSPKSGRLPVIWGYWLYHGKFWVDGSPSGIECRCPAVLKYSQENIENCDRKWDEDIK